MAVATPSRPAATPAPEPAPLPVAPRLVACVRAAAGDLYFNSWRLVPMNLVWGLLLLAVLGAAGLGSGLALLALPLLALPQAGLARMAALIVRGETVALSDGFGAWPRFLVPALALGAAILAAAALLSFNLVTGLLDGGIVTVAVATLAAWGLVVLAAFGVAAWPLLADPAREDQPARERLRIAALLVVAHPVRAIALAVLVVVFLAVSTLAFAALLTVSVAFATQVAARYVLPAADRLEARLARGRGAAARG
ncbi:MAG: hypothetical protein U0838_12455 [Chloroflexota bacterium]